MVEDRDLVSILVYIHKTIPITRYHLMQTLRAHYNAIKLELSGGGWLYNIM